MVTKYFLIAPATVSYRGNKVLCYSSKSELKIGQIVKITLRSKMILGVVVASTDKPSFKISTIEDVLDFRLPMQYVELLIWAQQYYPGALGPLTLHFVPSFINSKLVVSLEKSKGRTVKLPKLTTEQKSVIEKIKQSRNPSTFMLHGETGTGKTRVYIELAKEALENSKSSLILTPEISLTAPLVKQFKEAVGEDRVLCVHSNMKVSERRKVWALLLSRAQPFVVIGPRSALFAPIKNIGLIVVDESHDQAYKEESSPYYYTLRLASKLSEITKSKLVFGSATPSINEYFMAESKKISILRMKDLAVKSSNTYPAPRIVDMTSLSEKSKYPFLSQTLTKEMASTLKGGGQIMLFLNRRGSSRCILCHNCGWRSLCPNCDTGLIYHQDAHLLQCHTCGHKQKPPVKCVNCGSTDIMYKSPGTKSIEVALKKLYPDKNVARFDRDNKINERIENMYEAIQSGKIDILIGTQLLTKGHDLPNLELAAMLAADSSLDFPDYTAEESSYQLINQLKGRINRGHRPGKLILQTFSPNNPTFKQALGSDWANFYESQINQRKRLNFPPFVHSLKLESARASRESAKKSLESILEKLSSLNGRLGITGPAPSYIEKKAGKYHWQLIITSRKRSVLTEIATQTPSSYKVNLDPLHFL